MDPLNTLRVSLLCALALMPALSATTVGASAGLGIRAGYDSDPDGGSNQERDDTWVSMTVGESLTQETSGPLTLSLNLALGATAYARLTDLDRISLVVTPAIDYIISPRVAATMALVTEGQLVEDGSRSAWGWGGNLRLRELLSPRVNLTEYLSYRDLNARNAEHSGTKAAIGFFLRTFPGERWMLGVGGEYAHGDFLVGDAQGPGVAGMGTGSHKSQRYSQNPVPKDEQTFVGQDEDRVSGSLVLDYSWSETLSTGAEYIYTRVNGEDGGENQHAVIVSTTYGF